MKACLQTLPLAQRFLDLVTLAEINKRHLIVEVTCHAGHVGKGRKRITGRGLLTYALFGLDMRIPLTNEGAVVAKAIRFMRFVGRVDPWRRGVPNRCVFSEN